MDRIKIRRPDDFHVHLRDGGMLDTVGPATSRRFARGLVMPNLVPPVASGPDVIRYKLRILRVTERAGGEFEPLMAFKVLPSTDADLVRQVAAAGAVAGKLYPAGVTTNSEDGVSDLEPLTLAFEAMQETGLVLCIHAELPGAFVMDRESAYLSRVAWIAERFPDLRIVIEHVTTTEACALVESGSFPNVAATITPHHLWTTLDDVVGGSLNSHAFCKPVPKRPEDRSSLIAAATGGSPKFFLGTDSAPHSVQDKESCGCAGVFNAPVALELLAEIFEDQGALNKLEGFTSRFGAEFYGLPLNDGSLELVRETWRVPDRWIEPSSSGPSVIVVPFLAGRKMRWRAALD